MWELRFKNASYVRVVGCGMTLGKILFMNLELKLFLIFIFIWYYKSAESIKN